MRARIKTCINKENLRFQSLVNMFVEKLPHNCKIEESFFVGAAYEG